ncbi:hypothetical protein ABT317_41665 [Streptomyces carpinensis]|uniref:Uncharacterized protein n=1 Tax=Streptomyces carpinensis TaxID=66369 RepID=A0ABV1WGH4_9ACTN
MPLTIRSDLDFCFDRTFGIVVDALRRLITGGGLGPVGVACVVLAGFTAAALALTALAARRGQVRTLDRLHPELSL